MTQPPPPLQADSPTVFPDGRVLPRYRPPDVGGGNFTVDLAKAPQAIRELEEARRELLSIRTEALSLGRVTPPSSDQVSLDAATLLGVAAVGGSGSFVAALDAGVAQIERYVDALKASLREYENTDTRNRDELDARS